MFDDIQEVEDIVISDKREAIEEVLKMKGMFVGVRAISKTRQEREMCDHVISLIECIEVTLKSFPPPGTYRKIS